MEKRKLWVKARRPHLYGTRRLEAGDEYEAPVEEAIALVASRKADFSKKPAVAAAETKPTVQEPPALSVPRYEPEREQAETIDDLRLQATQLGIDVDGRWGMARLRYEIEQAKSR